MALQDLLPLPVEVWRISSVSDGAGGFNDTYAPLETSAGPVQYFGRFQMLTARDVAIAQQKQATVTAAIYFEAGVDLRINDKIVSGGREYFVRVPNQAPPNYPYMRALLEEYQHG